MEERSLRIKAGFLPVRSEEFFREAIAEKGRHLVQHILQVEEVCSGKAKLWSEIQTYSFYQVLLNHTIQFKFA